MSGQQAPPAVNTPPAEGQDLILTVNVTAGHIKHGKPEACTACPIAIAVIEALALHLIPAHPNVPVTVTGDGVTVQMADGSILGGELPTKAREFIRHFDRGPSYGVEPFTFRLGLGRYDRRYWAGVREHHLQHQLLGPRELDWDRGE